MTFPLRSSKLDLFASMFCSRRPGIRRMGTEGGKGMHSCTRPFGVGTTKLGYFHKAQASIDARYFI